MSISPTADSKQFHRLLHSWDGLIFTIKINLIGADLDEMDEVDGSSFPPPSLFGDFTRGRIEGCRWQGHVESGVGIIRIWHCPLSDDSPVTASAVVGKYLLNIYFLMQGKPVVWATARKQALRLWSQLLQNC